MSLVYLDNAATTPMREEVLQAMLPYLSDTDGYGNPSSIHYFGQQARAALDNSRDIVAAALGCAPSEITFTSGGTEADNLAVVGTMHANRTKGSQFVTSKIEHEAVLNSAKLLQEIGFDITTVDPTIDGMIEPQLVEDAITENCALVSIMHANNEVGTIQPVREICELVHSKGALFHTDAVQSFGYLPINVDDIGADLISVSAHKIYGPKGVGALYTRQGTQISAVARGGGQERGRRSGTENVAGIVGFGEAVKLMTQERDEVAARLEILRDRFIHEARIKIPNLHINGSLTNRLPNNINFSIPGIEGESMLLNLDLAGIAASSGSACSAASIEPSHVLLAMNLAPENLRSAMRFTLGRTTTWEQLGWVLDVLQKTTKRLQGMTKHAMPA